MPQSPCGAAQTEGSASLCQWALCQWPCHRQCQKRLQALAPTEDDPRKTTQQKGRSHDGIPVRSSASQLVRRATPHELVGPEHAGLRRRAHRDGGHPLEALRRWAARRLRVQVRLDKAMAAKTRGDLNGLLVDLPPVHPEDVRAPARRPPPGLVGVHGARDPSRSRSESRHRSWRTASRGSWCSWCCSSCGGRAGPTTTITAGALEL